MDNSIGCYTVDPKKLDTAQRRVLAKKVYHEAHQAVFDGVSFKEFYHSVFEPPTVETKIIIYSHDNEIIGYSTFQLYEVKKEKIDLFIAMTEMCLKEKAYQYHIHPINFFVKESAKYILHHPLSKVFMIDTLVSPVIYKKLCHTAFQIYPVYNKEIPAEFVKLSHIAAKQFHWKFKHIGNSIVRKLHWIVKSQYVAKDTSTDPNKSYYSSIIPDFSMGKGLVVVVPITFFNIFATAIKSALYRIHHIVLNLLTRSM